jgi:SAM-dependent methyltransferase/putative flippase GtrA
MLSQLRKPLGNVGLYIALQKGIGADLVRYHCLDEAELKPGDRVLDVGCGPAYYFGRLPKVDYVGFDTSEAYVAYARQRYGEQGDFRCATLTADRLSELGQFDAVLLFGLLHHLDDTQCALLLDLSARALAPGGRVVSCDPTLHEGQHWVSRWMSQNDRGDYVRRPESYDRLARASFADLQTRVLDTLTRVPTSHYMMRMASPLEPVASSPRRPRPKVPAARGTFMTVPREAGDLSTPGREVRQPVASPLASESVLQVEIVVPVRNEERQLAASVRRLADYLRAEFPFRTCITIADNCSSDGTWAVAEKLAAELAEVRAVHLEQPGRGRALKSCWLASDADVLAYMDVDLSSGLEALLPLVAPLLSGHSDVAIGTRLARGARVSRGPRREVVSRCYNLLLQAVLDVGFSDAQCGFKAIRADKARLLLPLAQDDAWFFDTELLVLAERACLRVHEVPVDWIDDPDSRVNVYATAMADLWGVARLGWSISRGTLPAPAGAGAPQMSYAIKRLPGQVLRFIGIGVVSLLAYVVLYLLLRPVLSAQAANAVSLFVTAVANTAGNRRITFGIRGRARAARHLLMGLIAFGVGLAVTSAALAALHAVAPRPSQATEVVALIAANLFAAMVRFVLYRSWVFRPRQVPSEPLAATSERPEPGFGRSTAPGETLDTAISPKSF